MKRHPGLVPLSHDHHDALVVAQGLIRGRSKAPRSDWPTERRAQVDRVLAFYAETLRPHFEAEETDLFPLAAARLPAELELIQTLRDEHDQVRTLVRDLQRDPDTDLALRLPALGTLLEAHVRKEERKLFQAMQAGIAPTELDWLGLRLAGRLRRDASCRVPGA